MECGHPQVLVLKTCPSHIYELFQVGQHNVQLNLFPTKPLVVVGGIGGGMGGGGADFTTINISTPEGAAFSMMCIYPKSINRKGILRITKK